MSRKNPWSYKIDYTKAIQLDEQEISGLVRLLGLSKLMTDEERMNVEKYTLTTAEFLGYAQGEALVARCAAMGVTMEEVLALRYYDDIPVEPSAEPSGAAYRLGADVSRRICPLGEWFRTEEQMLAQLKRAKARLATHKRKLAQEVRP